MRTIEEDTIIYKGDIYLVQLSTNIKIRISSF